MEAEERPLWVCPGCSRRFANPHQSHACGPLDLAHHLEGRSDAVRATYAAFLALLEENGPVTVLPEKTRIAFQVRMSFAQLTLAQGAGRSAISCWRGASTTRRSPGSRRSRRATICMPSGSTVPTRSRSSRPWTPEAYLVGCQDHLSTVT